MKLQDICAALRERYKQPEWALFFEVGNGTGANCRRHADALAMNMYPSRGLSIIGFEIKVSRSDLKHELENPDKAEEIARFCDEWYLAVPKGLIKADDLIPATWGVLECEGNGLRINRKAAQLQPQTVTKQFMAAVIRSASKLDEKTLEQVKSEAYQRYAEERETDIKARVEIETKRIRETLKNYEEFEKLIGQKISSYSDVEGMAERWTMAKNLETLYGKYGQIRRMLNQMEHFVETTKKIVEEPQKGVV